MTSLAAALPSQRHGRIGRHQRRLQQEEPSCNRSLSPSGRRNLLQGHRMYSSPALSPTKSSSRLPPPRMSSLNNVGSKNQVNNSSSSKPQKFRLIVDYSKKRANLSTAAEAQSTSRSGKNSMIRRSKSLDHTTATTTFSNRHQQHQLRGRRQNIMTRTKSGREVVDWNKLSTTLAWEKNDHKDLRNDMQNTHFLHQSCSDILRQSFLTKPVGGESNNHAVQGKEYQFRKDTRASGISAMSNSSEHSTTITIHSSRRASNISPSTRRARSMSPSAPTTTRRPNSVSPTASNNKGSLKSDPVIPPEPQPSVSSSLTKTAAASRSSEMEDTSMHLVDLFGSMNNSDSTNNKSEEQNDTTEEGKQQADEVTSDDDDDEEEPENEKEALFKRLSYEAKPAPPLKPGRIYRSMSATMSAALSQGSSLSTSGQQHQKPQSISNRNATWGNATATQKQQKNNGSSGSIQDDGMDTSVSSLSFRRTSPKQLSSSSTHSKKKKKKKPQHLAEALGKLPTWDGDFDHSLSSMSSHWESMEDDSYARERRRKAEEKGLGATNNSSPKKTAANSVAALALGRAHEDDETETEDNDLLFLPPTAKVAAPLKRSATAPTAPPSRISNASSSSKQASVRESVNSTASPTVMGNTSKRRRQRTTDSRVSNDTSVRSLHQESNRSLQNSTKSLQHSTKSLQHSTKSLQHSTKSLQNSRSSFHSSRSSLQGSRSSLFDSSDSGNNNEFSMMFAVRRTQSGSSRRLDASNKSLGDSSQGGQQPANNNSDPNILCSNGMDDSDYLDEEDRKKQQRDKVIREKNPSFRNRFKRSNSGDVATMSWNRPSKGSTPSPGRRGGLKKQLSCDMLISEYERFSEEARQEHLEKTQQQMDRRNAALLVRADSVPDDIQQRLPKTPSSSQLLSSRRNIQQTVMTSTTNWSARDNNNNNKDIDSPTQRGRGLDKQGSSRRGAGRLRGRNNRSASPLGIKPPVPRKKLAGRSRSFDDDYGSSPARSNTGGFRESLMRQASFVTGSRIRRLNSGSASQNNTNHSSGFNGNDSSTNLLHMSSPNLSFTF